MTDTVLAVLEDLESPCSGPATLLHALDQLDLELGRLQTLDPQVWEPVLEKLLHLASFDHHSPELSYRLEGTVSIIQSLSFGAESDSGVQSRCPGQRERACNTCQRDNGVVG